MFKPEHLIKRSAAPSEMDSVKERQKKLRIRGNDIHLLERCERLWLNRTEFREQRARGNRFYCGDQWADTIVVNGKAMTYREYLAGTGNVVIQTNQIKNRVDTIAGVLVKEHNEPVCHAIDRDEQQYGEIMTTALQANCDKNSMQGLYVKWMREVCNGGWAIAHETYDDASGPSRRLDSWTQYINPNYAFFDGEGTDPRNWDLSIVGHFFYGSFEDICARFARRAEDYAILKEIYASQATVFREDAIGRPEDHFEEDALAFMHSADPNKCYVCEVWTKETRARRRLWDQNAGSEEIIDEDDAAYRREVRAENARRRQAGRAAGWSEAEIPYIVGDGYGRDADEKNGFFVDTFWYCRFLAPDGTILWEGESPYAGREHPYTYCLFPYLDGHIVGYMADAIDHNIAMNRAMVLHDWLVRCQAKGVTVVPKTIVPKDVSYQDFARSWTSIDDLVYIDIEPGQEKLMPQVFHGAAQTFDVSSLIATYARLMDSGTPVNGALQGKTPTSGTSGALYAQMATNASTPIAALMEEFHRFVQGVLTKKMKNIAQFYDEQRFASIAGRIDGIIGNANVNLNEVGDLEYDLRIKESADTPVFRAAINQDAKEFLMNGLISFEEYLTIADVPYADKILQGRQAREAEALAAQQANESAKEKINNYQN